MTSGLSVVVIVRNESRYLDGCLAAIEVAATRTPLAVQVVVVDGASRDDTVRRATAWSQRNDSAMTVEVLRCDRAGYGYQRNAGVALARHPWVAFVSADVRVGPDWLAGLADLRHQPVDLALGRFDLVAPPGRKPWLPALAATLYPSGGGGDEVVERCSTVHLAARRDALLNTPFDETLPACEDKDLAYRMQRRPGWRGVTTLPHRPRHLARERVGQFLGKLAAESRVLGMLDRRTGGDFPDCFGWRRHARGLAGSAVLAGTAGLVWRRSRVVPALAATAVLVTAGRHQAGWRRRDPDLPVVPQAALHAAAMLTVSVSYLGGWLYPRPGGWRGAGHAPSRHGAGGADAPRQGVHGPGPDSGGEPRGDPAAPVPCAAGPGRP